VYLTYFNDTDGHILIRKFWINNDTTSDAQLLVDSADTASDFDHTFNSIVVDELGYIHFSWSCHNSHPGGFGMKYRRSNSSEDITTWDTIEYDTGTIGITMVVMVI